MQTKTTLRSLSISVRMPVFKITGNNVGKDLGKINLYKLLMRIEISTATVEISMKITILKIELSYPPAIPLLGIYSKELRSTYYRDVCIPMFTEA